jgi:hypothetical protein
MCYFLVCHGTVILRAYLKSSLQIVQLLPADIAAGHFFVEETRGSTLESALLVTYIGAKMKTLLTERRSTLGEDALHVNLSDISNAIRQGLLLQNRTGTRSAVEHMKALKIPGSVIGRVLSGGAMRAEDWGPATKK